MRLRSAILFFLLSLISAHAQTGSLEVSVKAKETADAPDAGRIMLYRKSKALVIGMDRYDGKSWPKLSNGVRDAEEVAKALAGQGFEVTLRRDLKSDELDRTLKSFFIYEGADPEARLLLWFAGHGHTIDDEGYIVPVDAPSPDSNDADFRDKAISLRRFGEYMHEAKAKHVLAIFDSCFAGTIFNVARSLPPPAITLATTQPVREFISSGEAQQTVSDDGTFRKLFLDVLAGKEPDADANHDGYVTGTELGLFLHQKMTNLTNNQQTPRYGKLSAYGYDRGDFVFQIGALPAPAAPTPITQPASDSAVEVAFWSSIRNEKNPQLFEAYLRRYPNGAFADIAKITLDGLTKTALATPVQPDDKIAIGDPGLLREVRERLYELNFDPGSVDGPDTEAARQAIREFEQQNHLAQTGVATMGLLQRLRQIGELKPWGAIVYAPGEEKWGMSWGTSSRKEAVASARASCGSVKCTTEVSFFGTECGAFSHSGGVWAIVARDSVQRAKEAALADCRKRGKACQIVAAVCADGAERTSSAN
jgi:hypothetical protein